MKDAFGETPPRSPHIASAIKNRDYLSACEWIKTRMDERWNPYLINRFLTPQYQHNSLHESIFLLDTGVYITPNFDKIFDNYVSEQTDGTTIVKTYYDDDVQSLIRNGTRLVIKMHGTIDAPDRMIFGRVKYAEARVKHAAFYQLMDSLLLTSTFLIVGCGLEDPDFQLLFENFNYRFPGAQPHYMTFPGSPPAELESLIRETRKLKLLKYSRAHEHRELGESLSALVSLVEKERQLMAGSQTW